MKPSISEEILKKYGLKGIHPIADLFPLLAGADRDEFRESVKERGVVAPIAVNLQGILLEGRNRLIIADELGVECPKVVVDVNDEAGWIIAMNLKRRHLDAGQRAMIAEQLANMPLGGADYRSLNLDTDKSSMVDAAKKMQVSRASVAIARRVRKKAAPEVVEKVKSGEMTLHAAHETVKRLEQPEQVGGKEIKPPNAEIDAQCSARLNKIVRLIQELFSALDADRSSFAAQTLHNEIERISSKAQKKKQARASELGQQKLNFSGAGRA
jgi:hypothetical protein